MDVDMTGVDSFFNYLVHSPTCVREHLESSPKREKTVSSKRVLPGFKFLLGKKYEKFDSLGSFISKMGIIIIPLDNGSCGDYWAVAVPVIGT